MSKIETMIHGLAIGDFHPVRLMGIINLSRESFYNHSFFSKPEDISVRIQEMIDSGATIIDVGARSTAPGVAPISISEEKNRLIPVVKSITKDHECLISIDTQHAEIARECLEAGAHVINDISSFKTDAKMVDVIADFSAAVILMATEFRPGDALTVNTAIQVLKEAIESVEGRGLDPRNIIIDPGIGRWIPEKTANHNVHLINRLEELRILNKPILIGISRKSFIGDILGIPDPADRLEGTLISTAIAIYNGAHVIRTHDVKASRQMVKLSQYFRDLKIRD
ncbi:MAG: dihydropteroate synthase [Candidatus Helarchaeota archaeon]